jgi:hypothetical protein
MKYKYTTPNQDWLKFTDGETPIEFNRKQPEKYPGWCKKLDEFESSGGVVEAFETAEEITTREAKEIENAIEAQRALCKKYLAESDHKVNGDWPYVDDIPKWKSSREEWRAIIKSTKIETVKPPPF